MKYCCDRFKKECNEIQALMGGGYAYPKEMNPTSQIIFSDNGEGKKTWNVNGCCGGGCYVLIDLKFCPWCGTKLKGLK